MTKYVIDCAINEIGVLESTDRTHQAGASRPFGCEFDGTGFDPRHSQRRAAGTPPPNRLREFPEREAEYGEFALLGA